MLSTIILMNYRVSVNEIVHLTASQQQTNLDLIKQNIEEKLRSLETNAVVLSRQRSLNEVINNRTSYYQAYSLSIDFSNSVYSNGALHSIEIYMNDPPTNNIQNPVRYGHLDHAKQSDWIHLLDKQISAWLGIRTVEMIAGEERVISHARVINNARGDMQAIIVLNLDPLIVENWLRSYPNESTLYLINENDHVLASTNHVVIGENYAVSSAIKEQPYLIEGDELVVKTDLLPYEWKLIGVTPYHELTESSKQVAKDLLLFSALLTLVVIIIISVLTNQLTKPIAKLTDLMNHYHLDSTVQDIPKDYHNEFGQLFSGYRNLITRNEHLHNSLIKQYKQHKHAELRALQANINPHFLYNTLDQLNWRAIEQGDDEMSMMIELLGDMLRTGLSNGESIMTIEEEVDYVEKYLKLQVIRKQNHFHYQISCQDSISQALIPKLTLQPFVENAIIHGLQDLKDGLITISISEKNEMVLISIKDNGVGADSFTKSNKVIKTGGYGIKNVKERLNHYYNNKAKVNLFNRAEGGVEVQLVIPKVTNKDEFSF